MSFRDETNGKNLKIIDELLSGQPEFLQNFNNSLAVSTTASTRVAYLRAIIAFFEYMKEDGIEATPEALENLSPEYFEGYFAYLEHYEKDGEIRTNSRVTLRRKRSSLNALYTYLLNHRHISKNPLFTVRSPKVPEKKIVRMDRKETNSFLDTTKNGYGIVSRMEEKYYYAYHKRDYAIVSLLLSTGIRVSECVGLNLDDLDLENHAIRVIRKGGKEDIVYFNDDVSEILKDYLEFRKQFKSDSPALFLSAQQKRYTVRGVQYMVGKYAKRAHLMKKISPHKLRSTFGTALYEETSDLYLVAEVLGHRNIEVTRKHYAELSEERKIQNRGAVNWNGRKEQTEL